MGKVILGALLGLFVTGIGLTLSFAYLLWMEDGGNILLLPAGIVLFAVGIFLLFKFGRIDVFKPKFKESTAQAAGGGVLQRNSKIISEWNQTEDKKEKLKLLKMASAAEEVKNS